MTFALTSSAFSPMGAIPKIHTCQGDDSSPPLQWSDVPDNTCSLVLIVDDPDAPDPKAPKMIWVHWLVYNIPPHTYSLASNTTANTLPEGAQQGINDWQRGDYGGPCPPIGRHRYFFKLYALDTVLPVMNKPNKAQLESAMQGHILAQAELIGTYQK